ncbi:hypothetical protein B0H17DRAFT_1144014 [Mycena rosella]|uniref:Uncharacterized protein n=1 Tax=Mycena rosella TaxID=1033263 RepID=A0AAD7G7J6_MYCRO|nr:hypothetical protein B0H17DRAFT_1144014 [Mycena rosella]
MAIFAHFGPFFADLADLPAFSPFCGPHISISAVYFGTIQSVPDRCLIPDTPKFKKYKPVPGKGKAVSVTGFLTGLEHNEDKTVKEFIVDVDTMTFLGQPAGSTAPKAEESSAKIAQGTPARLKFTGFVGNQGSDTKSDQPASKKHKMVDDRAQEEADDKEEGSSNGRLRRR